jgi:hypothetical protein
MTDILVLGIMRRNVNGLCIIGDKTRSQMIDALCSVKKHAKVVSDCTESVKLIEPAIICLQLGTFKMICTLNPEY